MEKITKPECLIDREHEICLELIKGISNLNIADKLFISKNTVKVHLTNIYKKLGIRNRVELTNLYISKVL